MDLLINGKHVDVGDALRAHVEEMLNGAVSKHFDRPLDGTVTFSREGVNFRVDISVHAARGVLMQGSATAAAAYAAFDGTLVKIAKRLRRHNRRLRDRHKRGGDHAEEAVAAPEPEFAPGDEDYEHARRRQARRDRRAADRHHDACGFRGGHAGGTRGRDRADV